MTPALRRLAAAALLTLCATPAALPQATNLPARANSTFGVNTNGVVKVPRNTVYWPTQTNLFHKATITNLTVSTITGVDASEVAVADAANNFATNTVEAALLELANDVAAVDASSYLPKAGGTMTGAINMGVNNITNVNYLAFDAVSGGAENSLYVNATEDLIYLRGAGSASPGTASMLVMSSDGLVSPYDLKQVGATHGQVIAWDEVIDGRWEPLSLATVATSGSAADLSGTLDIARLANGSVTAAKLANTYLLEMPAGGVTNAVSTGLIYATDGTQHYRLQNNGTVGLLGQAASAGLLQFYQTYPAMNGSAITSLTAGNLSGTVPTANLGSGTANSTTYLRGDQTWAAVSAGIAGSTGSTDNLALRADGAGGATLQSSDLSIEDVTTSTANNIQLKNVHAGQTNSGIVLTAKGSGALVFGPRPDGGTGGGSARGIYAVDLQNAPRSNANQVSSGSYSFIGSGERNRNASNLGAIVGGYGNAATVQDYIFIGAGLSNASSGWSAGVVAGESNEATGSRSGVAFGHDNTASGANAFVGGGGTGSAGAGNTASGTGSAILGGSLNTATQSYSASLGGANNNITATYGAGLGGDNADVSASYAIAGGRETLADQTYGVALGYYADTDHQAGLTIAGGRVAATGDSQTALTPARVQTIDATPTALFLDGSSVRWTVASGVSYACEVQVVGRSSGGESAAYWFRCLVENNGGTTTLIGGGTALTSFEDNASWDCAITADDTNDALLVTVTGASSTTITWSATILSTKAK